MGIFTKMFGSAGDKARKQIQPLVDRVNALEGAMQALSDAQLAQKTGEFKTRLAEGEALDGLLPEAFAAVREAAVRTVGMRHFDVQLIGGVVLHQGRIAEMKTGEGKTLVATLPAYLNALTGKGVHIVTVNDYLARRDSEWMGKIYRFLGMTVGLIVHGLDHDERREAYGADITYGTNNEYGFDYLRDNMVVYKREMVQRELAYAIVDEVDSILIDEARTPLIISGSGDKSTDLYARADKFVRKLERGPDIVKLSRMEMLQQQHEEEQGDFNVDEKAKTVALTTEGQTKAEAFFQIESLADVENTQINHHIIQALRAHTTMRRDKDYVVQDGQVIIVDEFTGRLMWGRRYSDGLHQAIEAKEGVKVERESKTLATITFQNYFRMYHKLAGMTGTAKTEEEEFQSIYMLDVVEIPTHRQMIRTDHNDAVYATLKGKLRAIVSEIAEIHKIGRPILVGTVSVEKSELLSELLTRQGIKHEVLNAKHHLKEAEIVAQAGKLGKVTIATNMAGRGTDILLGGNPDFLTRREMRQDDTEDALIEEATSHADTSDEEVLAARAKYAELFAGYKAQCDEEHQKVVALGGLHILGTERHESRRIDNQLRGRSGRQGDPGSSRFYISLEDDLMRLFGSERIAGLMNRLTPNDDFPMDIGLLSKQIEGAQKRVENHNFDIRKHVLQYDDVMNGQREIIYGQRRRVLMDEDVSGSILEMIREQVSEAVQMYCPPGTYYDDWDLAGLCKHLQKLCMPSGCDFPGAEAELERLKLEEITARLSETSEKDYRAKETEIMAAGVDMREVERVVLLRMVDSKWMDHIDAMDQLKQGIGLRAYGQKDPVVEYRIEGHAMFEEMVAGIREETVKLLYRVTVATPPKAREQIAKPDEGVIREPARAARTGRNAACPCGSGKKYKNCCGRE